jgi:hypothetical protein
MSGLSSLQREFQEYVLRGEPAIAARVERGPLDNHERRLAIYYDAYRLRLIEALGTDFEALTAVMGEEGFKEACVAFIQCTPSTFRNVRWYGGTLPAFLRNVSPWSEQPWLGEIALFEWALTLAFDAADDPPVRFEALAALPGEAWEHLSLRLHPAVQLLRLRTNAPAFRKAVDGGDSLPKPKLNDGATDWLVWRKDFSVHFRSLAEPEAWAIQTARRGASFPEICEGLCKWTSEDETPAMAAGWLRGWVDEHLISGYDYAAPS